jgi:hypothetical protein
MKKIDIKSFGYLPSKSLRRAITWLNRRKKSFLKNDMWFDYPYYWGMPKNITRYLSGDEVDFIQYETWDWWNKK